MSTYMCDLWKYEKLLALARHDDRCLMQAFIQ